MTAQGTQGIPDRGGYDAGFAAGFEAGRSTSIELAPRIELVGALARQGFLVLGSSEPDPEVAELKARVAALEQRVHTLEAVTTGDTAMLTAARDLLWPPATTLDARVDRAHLLQRLDERLRRAP